MSDAKSDKAFLRQQFDVLCGAYRYPPRDSQFAAWETWLAEFPQWAVGRVVINAPDRWPEMPEVGPLRSAILEILKKKRNEEREAQARHNPPPEDTPESYTGDPEFLELAMRWEKEDREDPTKRSRGHQRAAELNALWARKSRIETLAGESVELQQNPKGKQQRIPR